MKKGFMRLFILKNLYKEPLHGYAIIKNISEKSGGFWSPKPGNVYPLIRGMLEEGLIELAGSDSRRKRYRITENGKAELLELIAEAEDSTIHLLEAMSGSEDEWIGTHLQILRELSPEDMDERALNQRRNLERLLDILSRTVWKLEKIQSAALGGPDGERADKNGGD
jgi:DNA-binding PadR family transcriptional regulator